MQPMTEVGGTEGRVSIAPSSDRRRTDLPTTLDALVHDPVAFRHWYDLTLPRVYRYLLARAGEPWLAEELTQQTFVEAIRNRRRFDGRSDVVSWLCAIGRNKLVDHYRRAGREARHSQQLTRWPDHPDVATAYAERDAVLRALGQLRREYQLALLFRYLDGMSVRDVAQVLGRSEKATESLLARARDGFRTAYRGSSHA